MQCKRIPFGFSQWLQRSSCKSPHMYPRTASTLIGRLKARLWRPWYVIPNTKLSNPFMSSQHFVIPSAKSIILLGEKVDNGNYSIPSHRISEYLSWKQPNSPFATVIQHLTCHHTFQLNFAKFTSELTHKLICQLVDYPELLLKSQTRNIVDAYYT